MNPETFDDLGEIDTGNLTLADGTGLPRHMLADAPEDDNPRQLAGGPVASQGWGQ